MDNLAHLYTDYLLASTGLTTSTGLSAVLDSDIGHDKITRFLAGEQLDSKWLWSEAKPIVEELSDSRATAVLAIDDSIAEKPYSSENELICWHYDHSKDRTVKGINFVSSVLRTKQVSLPVAMELVRKDKIITDKATGKQKRQSQLTKNDLFRQMVNACNQNMHLDYVLADSWYCSAENIKHLAREGLDWVMAVKSNRLAARSPEDKKNGIYTNIRSLDLEPNSTAKVWLKGLDEPLVLTKQVFKNEDDTEGILYLLSSDLSLDADQITALYQKRWCVEEYHKSLKNNSSLQASPTKVPRTQSNHCYLSVGAFLKLEKLKLRNHDQNHFALKAKIYLHATKAAMDQVKKLSTFPKDRAA